MTMYQHPLERILIYTDKEKKEEFNLPKEIWNELYKLFVTTKYDVLDETITAVDFFNEVFYELTFTYANDDAAEQLNNYLYCNNPLCPSIPELADPQNHADAKAAKEYNEHRRNINGYILCFVWYILSRQNELPAHVEAFHAALDNLLENSWSFDFHVSPFYDFLDEHDDKFSISFDINPELDINILMCTTEEWKEATDDFDREIVNHIVMRFKKEDDRRTLIEEIRTHLEKDNQNPNRSNRMVSLITHRRKANDTSLNELLLKTLPTAENADDHTNRVHKGGFVDYILRDQQKVLDVLMLVASMGNSQLAILIKFIKAFQQLKYIQADCFNKLDLFIKNAADQFPGVSFDKANVKKYIQKGTKPGETAYVESVQKIATYLQPLL